MNGCWLKGARRAQMTHIRTARNLLDTHIVIYYTTHYKNPLIPCRYRFQAGVLYVLPSSLYERRFVIQHIERVEIDTDMISASLKNAMARLTARINWSALLGEGSAWILMIPGSAARTRSSTSERAENRLSS